MLGNFEIGTEIWKGNEMLGNLKANGFDSLQKIYLFCSRGNKMYFLER